MADCVKVPSSASFIFVTALSAIPAVTIAFAEICYASILPSTNAELSTEVGARSAAVNVSVATPEAVIFEIAICVFYLYLYIKMV